MEFYGHSAQDGSNRLQTLDEHLNNTASLAEAFASEFGVGNLGRLLGLVHDIGKASAPGQRRILGGSIRVDHSTAGAQWLWEHSQKFLAYAIAGHHGGLPNGGTRAAIQGDPTLNGRVRKQIPDISDYLGSHDIQKFDSLPSFQLSTKGVYTVSVLIRMLFSSLVDADFLDTERFMSEGRIKRGGYDEMPVLLHRLQAFVEPFLVPSNSLNRIRTNILKHCIQAAQNPQGVYTLTVPTGGGKTIASFSFALHHAMHHNLRRVIYALPYTSILEQNARVFEKIVGRENVLTHYADAYGNESGDEAKDETDKKRLSIENWDTPVIVTTNVQLFESLYAASVSRCRKLHNIAGSVLILDEAQMLPLMYQKPCVQILSELALNYHCTILLMSATQPVFTFPEKTLSREIMGEIDALYESLKRVQISLMEEVTAEALAQRLRQYPQALCIVNTRAQANELYQLIDDEDAFHLSTLMLPAHRRACIVEIRRRLSAGLPCRVVTTSLIEAGVDLDFPVGFRAQAGLDSLIQASGRVNREGKRALADSFLYVFQLTGIGRSAPRGMERPIEVMRLIARGYADISSPQAVQAYFKELFSLEGEGLDRKSILSRLDNAAVTGLPFRDVAEDFKLIEDNTVPVFIPVDDESAALLACLQSGQADREMMREVGKHCVNLYPYQAEALLRVGAISYEKELTMYVLRDLNRYQAKTGLDVSVSDGQGFMV